tara:strand:- start:2661 stop:3017 length:357 start_codon:yes stop_codon:yes gene_type:complete
MHIKFTIHDKIKQYCTRCWGCWGCWGYNDIGSNAAAAAEDGAEWLESKHMIGACPTFQHISNVYDGVAVDHNEKVRLSMMLDWTEGGLCTGQLNPDTGEESDIAYISIRHDGCGPSFL